MTGFEGFQVPYEIRSNAEAQGVLTRILEETEKIESATALDDAQETARAIVVELRRLRSALNY